ncbi:hypothetical protein N5F23_08360 [Pseudomonas sichuanensis]|uniref:hypothetical protein n=1 Tax=Pseudomonas sichuanensis TaxID=2213015 RepID=UPI002447A761|nr:hypothetical protein [Pseudomonas sichuanensis]MDH0732496.1 hypothetical protein [Pseudomonas sichuanensis]MDH1582605.1 hypothetical protein [Pseudomonas sichuanensis]MDH1592518.1 hypothetical protein [Pseudomonas sichuanensis]MDH1597730.1 hypothetical protein [Pseudomonas sichuanensis]
MASVFFDVKSVECIFTQNKPPQVFLDTTDGERYLAELDIATGAQEIVTTFDPDKHQLSGFGFVTEEGSSWSRITLFVLDKAPKGASRATREQLAEITGKSLQ